MTRCSHGKGPEGYDNPRSITVTYADGTTRLVTHERCWNCREVLPLGPANDSGPHAASVACEVRAAELATGAHMDEWYGTHWLVGDWTDDEARGWSLAETNMQNHTDRWHAGYLARAIVMHRENDQ